MADQTEIVIHPVSPQGGRKVTVHALGVDPRTWAGRSRPQTCRSSCAGPASPRRQGSPGEQR
ncbi:hypothetical protein WKI68_02575 [Streptomyces sp. MS1.HAVA.3]|uniref:Uncharacterized protein n=1 Tax=Streptomyces caledonius TaxID=3134107 RepID=A0ABU8U067_9ACTN